MKIVDWDIKHQHKQNYFFQKLSSRTLSECLTFCIHIRTHTLLVLIWIETVCKGYQLMTKVKELNNARISSQNSALNLQRQSENNIS